MSEGVETWYTLKCLGNMQCFCLTGSKSVGEWQEKARDGVGARIQ